MVRQFRDYKYWIDNRAGEIAIEEYETEFEDLPQDKQRKVYQQAEDAYREAYADMVDAIYETMRDKFALRGYVGISRDD